MIGQMFKTQKHFISLFFKVGYLFHGTRLFGITEKGRYSSYLMLLVMLGRSGNDPQYS